MFFLIPIKLMSQEPAAPQDTLTLLLREQEEKAKKPLAGDLVSAITEKLLRRHGFKLVGPVSILQSDCLNEPLTWLQLLKENEKNGATWVVALLQSHLRSSFAVQPHLVEQLCKLIFALSLTYSLAVKQKLNDFDTFCAVEPLLEVMHEQMAYLLAKKAASVNRLDANASADLVSSMRTGGSSLADKVEESARKLGKNGKDRTDDFSRKRVRD